jgi:adenosylcobyric acid synthase
MVCGTTSDAGKSRVVTGLCRSLARRGVRVAPFKAQNMALNSYVTASGYEIGRAQGVQALAAGVEPEVDMNPILLKPTGERTSQVVVLGRPLGHLDAGAYHAAKPGLRGVVLDALERLRGRFDVIVLEGAGSPAEINLLEHDIVNLSVAEAAGAPAVVVGDIDRGGVFAALYGTHALLPDHLRRLVRGFVINKFRGDPALLAPGLAALQARTGVPTLGVLPWTDGLDLDAEDSLALPAAGGRTAAPGAGALDVAVVRFPRISNFTDFDALAVEPGVSVRFVEHPGALGRPDLVVLPGTKATVADLAWLRERHFPEALRHCTTVLGICGGYQMLGHRIDDAVESGAGTIEGLGWLPVDTRFEVTKVTRQRLGRAYGHPLSGYQIHHGRTFPCLHGRQAGPCLRGQPAGPCLDGRQSGTAGPWIALDDGWGAEPDGASSSDGRVLGTTLHGLFESDPFRGAFLAEAARRQGKHFAPSGVSFQGERMALFDRLADLLETHLDMTALDALIAEGAPGPVQTARRGVGAPRSGGAWGWGPRRAGEAAETR